MAEAVHIWRAKGITKHKIPGPDFYNDVRSLSFKTINKPIPTTLFVRCKMIKVKYLGQDRTPTCSICKTRGHYRTECPRTQETPIQREDPISAQEPEPEPTQELESVSEAKSVISDTTTDITTTISTTSTWNKYKLAGLDWDTTDLDFPKPKETAREENFLLNSRVTEW